MRDSLEPAREVSSPAENASRDSPQESMVKMEGLPTAQQLLEYEAVSPGMADRVLHVIERESEVSLERIGLQRQQSLMAAVISGALVAMAGFGILVEVFWPVVLVLGLSGMATLVLREVIGRWTK